jgi:hypothetical protein
VAPALIADDLEKADRILWSTLIACSGMGCGHRKEPGPAKGDNADNLNMSTVDRFLCGTYTTLDSLNLERATVVKSSQFKTF